MTICKHCGRDLVRECGQWADPQARGDDSVWRSVCDMNETFVADHEPADRPDWHPSYGDRPPTRAERTTAVRQRLGVGEYRPNLKLRGYVGLLTICGSLAAIDTWPVAFGLMGVAVWIMWPILSRRDW